jgi:hypothetical protein
MALIHGPLVDLIGQPIDHRASPEPALEIIPTEGIAMAKAPYDGTYQDANGNYFVARKGHPIPEGATMNPDENAAPEEEAVEVEERAKPAAPENRAKAAPEARGKK